MFRSRVPKTRWQKFREVLWPRAGWVRTAKYGWRRVSRISGTPHAIALGFACGAFASVTPLLGFHFLLSFFLAWIVRGNLLASAFGTAVGNPLTFPLFWFATYDIGQWMMGGLFGISDLAPLNLADAGSGLQEWSWQALDQVLPIWTPMLIGAVPLGLAIGSICYFLVKAGVGAFQQRRRRLMIERAAKANEIEAA